LAECCARYVPKARGCRRLLQSTSLNITSAVSFASTRVSLTELFMTLLMKRCTLFE